MKKTIYLVVALTIITGTFVAAQESDQNANDMREAKIVLGREKGEVKNITVWDSNPKLDEIINGNSDRVFVTYYYPVRTNRAPNGQDQRFYQSKAESLLAELLQSSIQSYQMSYLGNIYGENIPLEQTEAAENVTYQSTKKILQNVQRNGEKLFSGELDDGTRVYGGRLTLSVSQDSITKAVEENSAKIIPENENSKENSKTDKTTLDDMQKKMDLIKSILDKIPGLNDTNNQDKLLQDNRNVPEDNKVQ